MTTKLKTTPCDGFLRLTFEGEDDTLLGTIKPCVPWEGDTCTVEVDIFGIRGVKRFRSPIAAEHYAASILIEIFAD